MKQKPIPELYENVDLKGRSWFAASGKPDIVVDAAAFVRKLFTHHDLIGARVAAAAEIKHSTFRTKLKRGAWSVTDLQALARALHLHNIGKLDLRSNQPALLPKTAGKGKAPKKGGAS